MTITRTRITVDRVQVKVKKTTKAAATVESMLIPLMQRLLQVTSKMMMYTLISINIQKQQKKTTERLIDNDYYGITQD